MELDTEKKCHREQYLGLQYCDPLGNRSLLLLELLGLKLMMFLMPEAETLIQLLLPEAILKINQ